MTGQWPSAASGEVRAAPWLTWTQIDQALRAGHRGCPGGESLPIVLHKHRGRPLRAPRSSEPLRVRQILSWADAWHQRTGRWPTSQSGAVAPAVSATWLAVAHALRRGNRGLPGGDSLARLLARYRGVRNTALRPHLTIAQILAWADAHYARTGQWPTTGVGKVRGVREESWSSLDTALNQGRRGLPSGSSLAKLLEQHRGRRNRLHSPRLSASRILSWADAHHRRTGKWPTMAADPVHGVPGETWSMINRALYQGLRGLPGGSSLSRFLMKHGRRPYQDPRPPRVPRPALSYAQILAWADEFYGRHGRWPGLDSGPIAGTVDTWASVDSAMRQRSRGLPEHSSIAVLLEKERGRIAKHRQPRLTTRDILAWAEAYHGRTGRWPTGKAGPIPEDPTGHNWAAVDAALWEGCRGLRGGDSIRRLLVRHRRVVPKKPLTVARILAWADKFQRRTGRWPNDKSGALDGERENWKALDMALRKGSRGLPAGSSLALLLRKERGAVHAQHRPNLTPARILLWADAHYRRMKRWPSIHSGLIAEAPGESWLGVDNCLRQGLRGAPGKDSLLQFLVRHGRIGPEDKRVKWLKSVGLV